MGTMVNTRNDQTGRAMDFGKNKMCTGRNIKDTAIMVGKDKIGSGEKKSQKLVLAQN